MTLVASLGVIDAARNLRAARQDTDRSRGLCLYSDWDGEWPGTMQETGALTGVMEEETVWNSK